MIRWRSLNLFVCTFVCAALSGCGGGGGGGASALPQVQPNALPLGAAQNVAVSIAIPPRQSSGSAVGRRPLYVSVNTQSAAISVNGGAPVIANLASGSPNCTATSGGGRTCTISVSAPAGTDTFSETTYASTDGSGAPLSVSTTSATIVAGKANTVSMTLGGVVASIGLTLGNPNPPVGSPATSTLTVTVKDASGAAIIGSDPFANPITLSDSDTSRATTLSKKTIATPADATGLTVAYTGAVMTAAAVFSASAPGVASTSVTSATLTPTPAQPSTLVDWPTYGYDNQRSGFNPYTTAITPASIANLHLAWQTSTNGSTQTQPIVVTNVAGHQALVIVAGYLTVKAFDVLSGALVWQRPLPKQDVQTCGSGGVSGSAVYDKALNAVFMAAGNGGTPNHAVLYKLDAGTGNIMGQVDVTPTLLPGEANFAHSGLTFANGRVYLGTGSDCEGTSTGLPSWRGRVVSVDPSSMTLLSTFFTTWGQGGNFGGGGVWAWGGVSSDPSGNIYVSSGNSETNASTSPLTPAAPFQQTADEQAGYAEHLVKLTADLSTVEGSNYPGFNFAIGNSDLDYTGTPVIYAPSVASGCGVLSATQGKNGTLVINNTQDLSVLNSFALSVPSAEAYYIGNPAFSPNTGYLYAPITSSGAGSSLLPPGLAAIGGCGSSIAWHAQFGPDSTAYTQGPNPRSAPTVTAGGVVFIGTPCTSDGNGGCGAPGAVNGAVWAVDGTTGSVLGGGKPILVTGDDIRMAPSADGQWVWVVDGSGNLYGLTVDPSVKAVAAKVGRRIPQTVTMRRK